MSPAATRSRLSLIAFAAFAGVASVDIGLRASRPAPILPCSVKILDGDPAVLARVEARIRVVDEVAAGRLTLLEAAAAFREIDARPLPDVVVAELSPGGSREEAYCRIVIAWVRWNAPQGRGDELSRALGADLDAWLRQRKPEPPES